MTEINYKPGDIIRYKSHYERDCLIIQSDGDLFVTDGDESFLIPACRCENVSLVEDTDGTIRQVIRQQLIDQITRLKIKLRGAEETYQKLFSSHDNPQR